MMEQISNGEYLEANNGILWELSELVKISFSDDKGTNWYNDATLNANPGNFSIGWTGIIII
jgi:hypothetical protein